jgi:hypothetical protein
MKIQPIVSSQTLTNSKRLRENRDCCFEGVKKYGPFDVDAAIARQWLQSPVNVNGLYNASVLRRLVTAMDIARRPDDRWVIDFGPNASEQQASCFELPFSHAEKSIKPYRLKVRDEKTKKKWWLYERPRPKLMKKIEPLSRYIATPRVAKHRVFIWLATVRV